MASGTTDSGETISVLRDCISALEGIATYRLPDPVDQRLLWLSENKESLSAQERDELLALAEFAEQRTVEKVRAQAALKRLADVRPDLMPSSS